MITSLFFIIPVLIILFLASFYNRLKRLKVRIGASIQEIGNQLKRQADLIPNLVESTKGYLSHEKEAIKLITDARQSILKAAESGQMEGIDKAQEKLQQALSSIRVVLESTPELKAAGVVQKLMDELRDTSDKLMYSRRTLIDLSADYNTSLETIPGVWIAPLLGFKPEKGLSTPSTGAHLEVSIADTKTPEVKL